MSPSSRGTPSRDGSLRTRLPPASRGLPFPLLVRSQDLPAHHPRLQAAPPPLPWNPAWGSSGYPDRKWGGGADHVGRRGLSYSVVRWVEGQTSKCLWGPHQLRGRSAERGLSWPFGFTAALGCLPGQGLLHGELWKQFTPTTPIPQVTRFQGFQK